MRIGVAARELSGRATGVGRYLRGLLHEWVRGGAAVHDFILYAPAPLDSVSPDRQLTPRLVAGEGGTWWEQVQLPRAAARDRLDVFFAPGYSAPLALRIPTVVAIHDVSFLAHPEWFRQREGMRRRLLARASQAQEEHPTYYGGALVALARVLLTTDRLGACPPT